MNPELPLRDIHLPPEPSWWPPAPGWWIVFALALILLFFLSRWLLRAFRRSRRRRALYASFEAAAALSEPTMRAAAISQVLRRAARLRDPNAATLQGEEWLRFLDGDAKAANDAAFSAGPGRVLLDAPYRPQVESDVVEAMVAAARKRFRTLVEAA